MPHHNRWPNALVFVGASAALFAAGSTRAQEAPPSRITAYPASFFAQSPSHSAFDMLALLPGYTFSDADNDVRGFAGAAGNVLIDGDRPASKSESLERMLRRIPASAVSRIELIRAGARGVDMHGYAVLANIVRARNVQMRGSAELASGFYENDPSTPRIAGEFSRQSGEELFEIAAAHYREVDDQYGVGRRPRVAPDGTLLSNADYERREGARISELAVGYEHSLSGGKLRVNGSLMREKSRADIREQRSFPEGEDESAVENELETVAELGLRFERPLDAGLQLELVGIHRGEREREGEREVEAQDSSLFHQYSRGSESIFRGVLRRVSDEWTLEGGAEAALNILDSRSDLQENGVDVALPAAAVRVEERRGEAFATTTWRMNAHWTLEAGSRLESSQLVQSGDSDVSRSFFFVKPRALLSFTPTPDVQWRVLVERRVGQLDFEDFVTSTSLSTDTVTAGNPDLEPDRSWVAELAWERRFMHRGSASLAVRREQIADLIDRIPVGAPPLVFDGVGNIGEGVREEVELNLSLPLRSVGLGSGLLKATALWRRSRASDPTTGETRAISEDAPFEGGVHFTQDLPHWRLHWGIDVEFARESREFMFDEVRLERFGTMVNVFAEYAPARDWNIRVYANNLADRPVRLERRIYSGLRDSAPLEYIETRLLRIGPYAGISVRRVF